VGPVMRCALPEMEQLRIPGRRDHPGEFVEKASPVVSLGFQSRPAAARGTLPA
jgi:hypothetical protein